MSLKSFFIAAMTIHLMDLLLTYAGLRMGFEEGNPLALWMMSKLGTVSGLLSIKMVAFLFTYFLYTLKAKGSLIFISVAGITIAIIPWVSIIALRMIGKA